ncbi:hypothetical protein ACFRCI_47495 [Streptomyces sp. NPDC056638]
MSHVRQESAVLTLRHLRHWQAGYAADVSTVVTGTTSTFGRTTRTQP